MPNFISEDQIEQAILKLLVEQLGYRHVNCFTADAAALPDGSGRTRKSDAILWDILHAKTRELNPGLPPAVLDEALARLTDRRAAMSPLLANKEVYNLLRDGVPVVYQNAQGRNEHARVKVIAFDDAAKNDFLAVSQLWIQGDLRYRRPDILLYVNGLPLVFIELKNSNVALKHAYDDNLCHYKQDIPQLFLANAACILSNAIDTRVGSVTAGWEHFFNWLRVEDETEKLDRKQIEREGMSVERTIRGLCAKEPLLDYLENFMLYYKDTDKIIAQNHQFIGVNKAIAAFAERGRKQGKLGVFWHTQGAGKSFSMIFYARKIFRKFTGNFSFVVITDREDLDGQIYRNFLHTETVKKHEAARPKNSEEMREFLSRNLRIVFTLIQKFRWDKGKTYPLLSERDDLIVIVDEAHRTQYKNLAENMRAGLPNAQYIAFTGTPLLGKDRKTNAWFGDYVSEYNFAQSIDDGATVPLFYEKRVPEVLIQNENLSEEFYQILEDENLDEKQQTKLESEYAKEVEIIKRDDRLDTIARDIVYHFPRRGYLGKGMVIAVDKFTAVNMYDKVQKYWKEEMKRLMKLIHASATSTPLSDRNRTSSGVEMNSPFDSAQGTGDSAQGTLRSSSEVEMNTPFDSAQGTGVSAQGPLRSSSEVEMSRTRMVAVFQYLRGVLDSILQRQDIDSAKQRISDLLDLSVVTAADQQFAAEHYGLIQRGKVWDLSQIDFVKLKSDFKQATYKQIEIADLRAFIEEKLAQMIRQNSTRADFAQKLQEIIDTYNAGGASTENYFDELLDFAEKLRDEQERHVREGLTQDELELFDLLKKDRMTRDEKQKVKLAARALLHRLLEESPRVLVQDWYKDTQTQARVRSAVEEALDRNLPDTYDKDLFQRKCKIVFDLIYDYSAKGEKWAA